MTFPILASLLVRLVVLLPFQLLRLSLATPSRWTPLAPSGFPHCVVALRKTEGSHRVHRERSEARRSKNARTKCVCGRLRENEKRTRTPTGRQHRGRRDKAR